MYWSQKYWGLFCKNEHLKLFHQERLLTSVIIAVTKDKKQSEAGRAQIFVTIQWKTIMFLRHDLNYRSAASLNKLWR